MNYFVDDVYVYDLQSNVPIQNHPRKLEHDELTIAPFKKLDIF